MRTIAITIDDDTLERVDRVAGRSEGHGKSRSSVIRRAVKEYVSRIERVSDEQREAAVIHRHRGRLAQQGRALVRGQAKP